MKQLCAVVAVCCLTGCGPTEPLNIVGVQTGKSLNSDHSIGRHAISFRPDDTMYVSVLTIGRGAGTIQVKWALRGYELHQVTKKVSYNGQAATDFRFAAADGFPVGDYTVEVIVDGKPFETRRIKVE
jgi:hypothetical protein